MKVAILMLALLGASYALSVEQEFQAWMRQHGKSYTGAEYERRFMNYKQTSLRIVRQTLQARTDGLDTEFAHNKFSDMSPAEFKAKYLNGYQRSEALLAQGKRVEIEVTDVPSSWNWVTQGKTTPVKDQQQCGSCWAFSATEGVESAWLMANKSQIILSPQQIVSCDTVDQGCNGGDLPTAFAYVKKAGLESNADYPYTSGGGNTGHCKYDASKVQVHISGFEYAVHDGRKNDTILATASYAHGPLSICVDAETWQNYNGGIIKKNCGTSLDHCVQLVGWGVQSSTEYWIVRNSWNTDWGKDGYIWIEKNSGRDLCGITEEATWVTL